MKTLLLRCFPSLPWLLVLLLGVAWPAQATHLLGGEMTYRYLGADGPAAAPLRYELSISVYVACNNSNTTSGIYIDFYDVATGALLPLTTDNNAAVITGGYLYAPQTSISACTNIAVPAGCNITGASQPYQLQKFITVINLPRSAAGFYAAASPDGNRNAGINNLAGGGAASSSYSLSLYSTLAPAEYANHSPVFVGDAVGLICANDTTVILNNAVDADGDRLVYSFGQPYSFSFPSSFTPPPATVPYTFSGGYSATTPLGTGTGYYAGINANTGITKYKGGPTIGNHYSIAIDVAEYRTVNGREVLLGTTRRDIQLVVGNCPPVSPPTFPTSTVLPRSYTVEAGSTLTVPISVTQADGHSLTLTATSALLDGAGGHNATFAGNPGTLTSTASPVGTYTLAGTTAGTVKGSFVYTPVCADARSTPYDVTVTASDIGCAGKITGDVLHITVTKPTGPTAVAGNLSVCGLNTVQSYTASGGTAATVQWSAPGGTIVGSNTANPVQVRWPTAGTFTLVAQGTTQYGCLTDPLTKTVVVSPVPTLAVTGSQTICAGSSTTLTVTGGAAPYTLTGGTTPVTGAGPFVLSPAQTTTYTIVGAASGSACGATGQLTVAVSPRPVATAGAAVAICSGGTGQLGAAPVAGSTYSWSPATGLSNANSANPTVTLTNPTGAPITQTYTLTETSTASGCQASNTVAVTVNPPPVANAGTALTVCSGSAGQLGVAAVAGYTYSWSPATGLSNANSANPTVTLTNPASAPITQTYTLTVISATGCTGTSTVAVTVTPLPIANTGPAVAICSGGTGKLGVAPIAGYTYNWSPATGLSSSTVANPTVTLSNTGTTATAQTYTLTVANGGNCTATSTVAVTVNPLPVATAGAAVAICSGGTGQLGAAPVAGYTYSWSPATGLSNVNSANPTVTLTDASSAPITLTYTLTVRSAATACATTSTVTVTVNPLPVANVGAAVTFCSGGTGQLGVAPVAGYTYSWTPATGLSSSSAANPAVTLTNTTRTPITQTYTLTVTSAAGCVSTSPAAVTVNPQPVANAGTTVAICSGGKAQLGVAPVAGYAYSWSPATDLSSSTVANPTVTLPNLTGAAFTQTYTLTVTNAAGCTNTSAVAVTVNPLPVANAGAAVAICSGGTGQLGDAPVAGYTYSWSPATGLSNANSANPTVTLSNTTAAPISQTYTLTVTNATGCTGTSTVAVTVTPLPVATAGAAVTICSDGTGRLGASSVAGYTYSWSPATGLSNASSADPTVTLTNSSSAPITQTYTLTVANAAGCTSTSTVAVTVSPAVTPGTIGPDQSVCVGSVPAPLASTAAAGGGSGTYDYQWESSLDNSTWQAIANVTGPSYAPSAVAATTYFRRRVTAGTCGVAYSNIVTIQAQPLLVPTVVLPTLPPQCAGTAFTFTPEPGNAGAAPTYQWSVNGMSVGAGPTYTSSTLADGDLVQVLLTPTAGFCATGTAVATARVSLTPVAAPTLAIKLQTALPVCVGAPISFSLDAAANVGTSPQYQWLVNGAAVAGATGTTFTSTSLRDGQAVSLMVRTTTVCGQPTTATSAALPVRVNQPVHVSAGPAKTIMEGESVVLEGTADGSYPVAWSPAATLAFAPGDTLRPTAAPLVTTTYVLSAGAGYCADQRSVTVTVLPRVRIPSAFTPNADNNDDTWQIANIDAYPNSHVVIFNRWGQKLFEASGYNRSNEWNGTYNGAPLPIGTYYYLLTLGNGKSYTGPLTIVY